ncbi:MAG TPA: hypothetical protein VF614_09635 [Chthoniobacteraceae bacterium]|jgi:hypothetical protein
MKRFTRLLAASAPGLVAIVSAGEIETFDLKNPPLPEPGKQYRLVVHPGKKAKPITLLFVADTSVAREPTEETNGKRWTGFDSLIQVGFGELPMSTEAGVVHVDVEDYNGDGYLDFRVPSNWGTGGTWYHYFRFNGKRYVPWKEPAELGINHFDLKTKTATASARSGPSRHTAFYKIVGGRFLMTGREIYDQAEEIRNLVPKEITDEEYVLIKEEIRNGKVAKRTVTKKNPWDGEPER